MIQALAPDLIEIDGAGFDTTDWRKAIVAPYFERSNDEKERGERGAKIGFAVFVLTLDGNYFHVCHPVASKALAEEDLDEVMAAWADAKWMAHPKSTPRGQE